MKIFVVSYSPNRTGLSTGRQAGAWEIRSHKG